MTDPTPDETPPDETPPDEAASPPDETPPAEGDRDAPHPGWKRMTVEVSLSRARTRSPRSACALAIPSVSMMTA